MNARFPLAALVFAFWSHAFCSDPASAALVTWSLTDTDGADNGVTADLMVGSSLVGTATIIRSGVTAFGTPTWITTEGQGLVLTEVGQQNDSTHSATYQVILDSVSPGWTIEGFGLSQIAPTVNSPEIANPDYAFTFNTDPGAAATVTEGGGIDYFANITDGDSFLSGTTLNANGNNLAPLGNPIIQGDNAEQWSIAFDPAITDYTLTYTTNINGSGEQTNLETLFFTLSATPEPSSLLLGGVALLGWFGILAGRRRRANRVGSRDRIQAAAGA